MNTNTFANQFFLNKVEPLGHDVYNYTKLDVLNVSLLSDNAANLIFMLNGNKILRWLPFSLIRKDRNNEIWIAKWLIKKIKNDIMIR